MLMRALVPYRYALMCFWFVIPILDSAIQVRIRNTCLPIFVSLLI